MFALIENCMLVVLRAASDSVSVGQYQRLRKYLHVLVLFMIQHSGDFFWELIVYLHASSLFDSSVCNFMSLHISKR